LECPRALFPIDRRHTLIDSRLQDIEGTADAARPAIQYMRVNHCCSNVVVTQKLLYCSYVVAGLEQVRREAVPQSSAVWRTSKFPHASKRPSSPFGSQTHGDDGDAGSAPPCRSNNSMPERPTATPILGTRSDISVPAHPEALPLPHPDRGRTDAGHGRSFDAPTVVRSTQPEAW